MTTEHIPPQDMTEIRHKMLENGYVPLANVDKRCMLKRWPSLEVDHDTIDDWADVRRYRATGVRIEGSLLALDFDIDDEDALDAIWDAIWEADESVGAKLDQMPLRGGKGHKICLFARLETGKIDKLWSKAFYRAEDFAADPEKAVLHRLEVFAGGGGVTRQVGVYGAHTLDEDGKMAVAYRWADGRGLADVPLAELPGLRRKDVFLIVDTVSRVLHKLGWEHEVAARHGKITESRALVLRPDMLFDTNTGDTVDLAGLEDMAGMAGLRVSMSFCELGAKNRTRGLVALNPADDRVQIWDTATATLYRPADLSLGATVSRLGDMLRERGIALPAAGESAGGAGGGADNAALVNADDGRLMIPVGDGELTDATWQVARWLSGQEDLYRRGGQVTRVHDGRMIMMSDARLAVEIGQWCMCVREEKVGGAVRLAEVDAPGVLTRQVASVVEEVGFRGLRGVVDIPVVRRDGTVVLEDGWDSESGLLVQTGGRFSGLGLGLGLDEGVGAGVDRAEALEALDVLMRPFRGFPLVGASARGALLAAVLTAVLRPGLRTAPAFALDAPAAGSGKTLLASCLMALGGGGKLYAPLNFRNEEEVSKVLLSVLVEKPRVALFDNQVGMVDSASLAAVLTSDTYSGRVLGSTKVVEIDTNLFVLFSGNNFTVVGDMTRRVLVVRIDPECEVPAARQFDFDPLREVRENRDAMIAAALRLVSWAGARRRRGRVGSFEEWDELVAQTVAALDLEDYADPSEALFEARDMDPQLEETYAVMSALREVFGAQWFRAADVIEALEMRVSGSGALRVLLDDLMTKVSARSVTHYLRFRKDVRVRGLRVIARQDASKHVGSTYRIASDDDEDVVSFGRWQARKQGVRDKIGHLKPPSG